MKILGFKSYEDFLKSPLWKEFKKQLAKNHNLTRCAKCGGKKQVSLHHTSYKHLLNPRSLAVLCQKCHFNQHKKGNINNQIKSTYLIGSKNVGLRFNNNYS